MITFPVQGPQGSEHVDLGDAAAAAGIGSAGPSSVQADLNARLTTAVLAGPIGAQGVGFAAPLNLEQTQLASTRTVQTVLREATRGNVAHYGAIADGVTDNLAAVSAAFNYQNASKPFFSQHFYDSYVGAGKLVFPKGHFAVSSFDFGSNQRIGLDIGGEARMQQL